MNKNEEIITLRAHHGMCFKYFVGEGYSSDFTKNMAAIKSLLDTNNPQVKIVAKKDIVCEKCPNLVLNRCLTQSKVDRYDSKVLSMCEIEEDTIMSYKDFSLLVSDKIIETGNREKICGDCKWTNLCK